MNDSILFAVNMLLVMIEGIIGVLLAGGFFKNKYEGVSWWLRVAILLIVWVALAFFFEDCPIVKIVVGVVTFSLWIKIVLKAGYVKSLFTIVFLYAYLYTIDTVSIMLFEITAGSKIDLYNNPATFYLFSYSAKIVSLLGIVIIRTWSKMKLHRQSAAGTDWLRTLFFPVSSLILVICLLNIYYLFPELAPNILICSVILLIANVMSILLLNHLEKQQSLMRDNIILQQNIKLERDNISAWIEAYAGQRKQTHDFQNQLLVARGMVEYNNEQEEIIAYLDQLLKVELPTSLFVNTHRTVVDIILNQKNAIARSKQIAFEARLDDLSAFALPDDALVVVLSNLIDNAIEACEKIENPSKRYILLKMQLQSETSILYIENPTNAPVRIYGNRVLTTKSDSVSHGYPVRYIDPSGREAARELIQYVPELVLLPPVASTGPVGWIIVAGVLIFAGAVYYDQVYLEPKREEKRQEYYENNVLPYENAAAIVAPLIGKEFNFINDYNFNLNLNLDFTFDFTFNFTFNFPDLGGLTFPDLSSLTFPDLSGLTFPDLSGLNFPDLGGLTFPDLGDLNFPDLGGLTFPDLGDLNIPPYFEDPTCADISSGIEKIASRYPIGKCVEASKAIRKYLEDNERKGHIIILAFSGRGDNKQNWVVSNTYPREAISSNGKHYGVTFEGKTYCNVHPYGLPEAAWINDFYGLGTRTITRIPF